MVIVDTTVCITVDTTKRIPYLAVVGNKFSKEAASSRAASMQVAIQSVELVEMKKQIVLRVAKLQAECKCLACEQPLGDDRVIRGVHVRCYDGIRRCIKSGKTTEIKVVTEGVMLPVAKVGRKPSNPAVLRLHLEN